MRYCPLKCKIKIFHIFICICNVVWLNVLVEFRSLLKFLVLVHKFLL